jgi:16S rRNA (uracil1498-N3)-methyltransferase
MRLTRVYYPQQIKPSMELDLEPNASKHILKVLRLGMRDKLIVFDGAGGEYLAKIIASDRGIAKIKLEQYLEPEVESKTNIHLAQGLARGEKMDYIIQKTTELGVKTITPLFTEFSNVTLPKERLANRLQHWQGVAISASEQSGRCIVPKITAPENFAAWVTAKSNILKLILCPEAKTSIVQLIKEKSPLPQNEIALLVGPEGGFSPQEIELTKEYGFLEVNLGPRILRTETAALAAISIITALTDVTQ